MENEQIHAPSDRQQPVLSTAIAVAAMLDDPRKRRLVQGAARQEHREREASLGKGKRATSEALGQSSRMEACKPH